MDLTLAVEAGPVIVAAVDAERDIAADYVAVAVEPVDAAAALVVD